MVLNLKGSREGRRVDRLVQNQVLGLRDRINGASHRNEVAANAPEVAFWEMCCLGLPEIFADPN